MTRRLAALLLSAMLVLAITPAAAERLIVSLSNHRVMVTSSYTGVDLVLFGSVERDQASETATSMAVAKARVPITSPRSGGSSRDRPVAR